VQRGKSGSDSSSLSASNALTFIVDTIIVEVPGTKVGHVVRRVGDTNIALASLGAGVAFENVGINGHECLREEARPQYHSNSIAPNDIYIIGGFSTGRQRLVGRGARFEVEREDDYPVLVSPDDDALRLPTPGTYISVIQGVSWAS
jgi:hypothetical protein